MYKYQLQGLRGLYEKISSGQAQEETKSKMKALGERQRSIRDANMAAVDEQPNPAETAAQWFMKIKQQNEELKKEEPIGPTGEGNTSRALYEVESREAERPRRRLDGKRGLGEAPDKVKGDYPISQREMEAIIVEEAEARGIDPGAAVAIFRSEGASAYQSQIRREGGGSFGGKEASFGPFQLYTGGGLGNKYEEATGRDLTQDNTPEGIRKQIQFSLDAAAEDGWGAWYGRKVAGIGTKEGLENARPLGNWRDS